MLINLLELATSQVLVIIGAPSSSTSKFSTARWLFANDTHDYHGPPHPKLSKACMMVKQKGQNTTTHRVHPEVVSINSQSLTPLGPPQHLTCSRCKIVIPNDCDDVHDMDHIGTNEDDDVPLHIKCHAVLSSSPPLHPPMLLKRRTTAILPSSRPGPLPLQDHSSKRKSVGSSQRQRGYL